MVCEFWMTPRARLFVGVGGFCVEVGLSGMFHRPLEKFRFPVMMILPFLKT